MFRRRLFSRGFAASLGCMALLAMSSWLHAQTSDSVQTPPTPTITQSVVDIPTRPGVTQRMLVLTPPAPQVPKAVVVLFPGGQGGLQLHANGSMKSGAGNFLVRTRQQFADQGLLVAVIDAPSDRQSPPYLQGYRERSEHVSDIRAVIAWLREKSKLPVWLVGTSRGTQSVAYVATELADADGPDGIVLTSTILRDKKEIAVPRLPLDRLRIPVLVVHHEEDACPLCSFSQVPELMRKLSQSPRKQLLSFTGGDSQGDPCEAYAHHGYNGIESEVVQQIAGWILAQ